VSATKECLGISAEEVKKTLEQLKKEADTDFKELVNDVATCDFYGLIVGGRNIENYHAVAELASKVSEQFKDYFKDARWKAIKASRFVLEFYDHCKIEKRRPEVPIEKIIEKLEELLRLPEKLIQS